MAASVAVAAAVWGKSSLLVTMAVRIWLASMVAQGGFELLQQAGKWVTESWRRGRRLTSSQGEGRRAGWWRWLVQRRRGLDSISLAADLCSEQEGGGPVRIWAVAAGLDLGGGGWTALIPRFLCLSSLLITSAVNVGSSCLAPVNCISHVFCMGITMRGHRTICPGQSYAVVTLFVSKVAAATAFMNGADPNMPYQEHRELSLRRLDYAISPMTAPPVQQMRASGDPATSFANRGRDAGA
ncbi:hypothetical protein AKJ16_DCAP16004 [Drosera capensis]